MSTINPYINFNGNAEEAFNFYKSVFGGEFSYFFRFKDMPEAGEVAEADKDKLMHISLPIGNGSILMASDIVESTDQKPATGNNISVYYEAESKEEADRIFNALSDGGKILMPIQDMFWGDYFGNFIDKFDIRWMISFPGSN